MRRSSETTALAGARNKGKAWHYLCMVLVTAGPMLGLSTTASVQAHVKRTGSHARARGVQARPGLGFQSHTTPHADGIVLERRGRLARRGASVSTRSRLVKPPVTGFKTLSGMDSETEVIARPKSPVR